MPYCGFDRSERKRMNLPEKYAQRMKKLLGEQYDDYVRSLDEPPVRAIKVNTEKISVDDFIRYSGLEDAALRKTA